MKKKTIVIGASDNPERYSYKAVQMLSQYQHPVVAVGLHQGRVNQVDIHTDRPQEQEVDTVTMYVGARNQPPYYDYILSLIHGGLFLIPALKIQSWSRKRKTKASMWCTDAHW
jgi:predicted CoA-binding protein